MAMPRTRAPEAPAPKREDWIDVAARDLRAELPRIERQAASDTTDGDAAWAFLVAEVFRRRSPGNRPAPTPQWREHATEAVRCVALRHEWFTVDDVRERLSALLSDAGETDTYCDTRVLGPVMSAAAERGWCKATERHQPSRVPSCHRNPRRVWASLIVESNELFAPVTAGAETPGQPARSSRGRGRREGKEVAGARRR